jgi:hypothetical protein
VLVDPWLARSVGFALSVSATAGILLLANRWARAMSRIPRRLALVVTVPLAAQVACTPVLMATFGQFSVASVPANILVAPVVVTAMVLGLGTTLLGVIFPPGAAILAWCAGAPSWWIASSTRFRVAALTSRLPESTCETVVGLTPKRYQSGETDVAGGISKSGDAMVRTALYEAANAVLSRPTRFSALKRWAMDVARRRGLKRAKVALARKLAGVLHRMWADGTEFRWSREVEAAA